MTKPEHPNHAAIYHAYTGSDKSEYRGSTIRGMGTDRRTVSPEKKEKVRRRDGYTCRICGREAALSSEDIGENERYYGGGLNLEVHHVEPRSVGGKNAEENLVTVCRNCHKKLHRRGNSSGLQYREMFDVYGTRSES